MTSILSLTELPIQSRESGITPQEQLEHLAFSQLERELGLVGEPLPLYKDAFLKSAIHSILRRSGLSIAASDLEKVPSLFNRSLELLIPARPLPLAETNWYIALKRIGSLPARIPPLPEDIHKILGNTCPIYGIPHKIKDTHSLYLIPAGTLNELEQRISAYGQQFFQYENPFKFKYFGIETRPPQANVPNSRPQWVLITNDVLPRSRAQTYAKQVEMVKALSTKSFTDYQVPTLREAALAIFLHKIATGESLYKAGNEQNSYLCTYTRVKDATRNWPLVIGGFAPSGLYVCRNYEDDRTYLGVAALRKF